MTCAPTGSTELVSRSPPKCRKPLTSGLVPNAIKLDGGWRKKNSTVFVVSRMTRAGDLCVLFILKKGYRGIHWSAVTCSSDWVIAQPIRLGHLHYHTSKFLVIDFRGESYPSYPPCQLCRFYIGCDKCQDWFHGTCVGVTQTEAELIDSYICPSCKESQVQAEKQPLSGKDYDMLKRLLRSLQVRWIRL